MIVHGFKAARGWGAVGWALVALGGVGCEGAGDPEYTPTPGYQGPVGNPGGPGLQPVRPQRPRVGVSAESLSFEPGTRRRVVRVSSTGARTLNVSRVEVVPGDEWGLRVREVDPRLNPEVLGDPDADGQPGVATGASFVVEVEYLGERDVDASAVLAVRTDDPETPEARVTLRYAVAGAPDAAVPDLGAPDASPDAGPPDEGPAADCQVDGDCALVMDLRRCDPCPYAAPVSAINAGQCRPAYEEGLPFFGYQPEQCLVGCEGLEQTFCAVPPVGARCRDGFCFTDP